MGSFGFRCGRAFSLLEFRIVAFVSAGSGAAGAPSVQTNEQPPPFLTPCCIRAISVHCCMRMPVCARCVYGAARGWRVIRQGKAFSLCRGTHSAGCPLGLQGTAWNSAGLAGAPEADVARLLHPTPLHPTSTPLPDLVCSWDRCRGSSSYFNQTSRARHRTMTRVRMVRGGLILVRRDGISRVCN